MPATYTLISSNVLSSTAASVAFTSIPSTYTDLVIRMSAKSTATNTATYAGYYRFNSQTSNYSNTYLLWSSGTYTPGSGRTSNAQEIQNLQVNTSNSLFTNVFNNTEIYIPNYGVVQSKPSSVFTVSEMNNTAGYDLGSVNAGLWRSTDVITSITLYPPSASWESGSSFYLYGISKS